MNIAFVLYDDASYDFVNVISGIEGQRIVGIVPVSGGNQSTVGGIPVYERIADIHHPIDRIVVLYNKEVIDAFAFQTVKECIESRTSIENYYPFNDKDLTTLEFMAETEKVEFRNKARLPWNNKTQGSSLKPMTEFPVVYISGCNEKCDVFETHICVSEMMKEQGYEVLNITNSVYSSMVGFVSLYSLFEDEKKDGIDYILSVREKIEHKAQEKKADVIVISNVHNFLMGIADLDYFGLDTFVIKNAVDIDYSIYNIPINFGNNLTIKMINEMKKEIIKATNCAKVVLGAAHVCMDDYADGSRRYMKVNEEEYFRCKSEMGIVMNMIDCLDMKQLKESLL